MTNMIPKKAAAISADLLKDIARLKGLPVGVVVPQQPGSALYPVSAALLKAQETALKNAEPGQEMPDGTIYLGKYSPTGLEGNSLGMEFNVVAAKEDLPEGPRTYVDTVQYMAELKNWNGFDGAGYKNDKELYNALRKDAYNGQWIIPTFEILRGKDEERKDTTFNSLFAYRNTEAFKGTFKIAARRNNDDDNDEPNLPDSYWSSTEPRDAPYGAFFVTFSDDHDWNDGWLYKDDRPGRAGRRLSCRPVRLVPCT